MTAGPPYRQIGIAGTGRVARALALALGPHASPPPLVWGRSAEKRDAAIAQIGRAAPAENCAALANACDVIVIAVSDDAIAPVAAEVARSLPAGRPILVAHVSGRSGAAVLQPLRARGALTAAIHPVMTFTGEPQLEVGRMVGARFAVTGSSEAATIAAGALVGLLGGIAVEIAEAHRPLYHAALCHAANHLVTLLAGSFRALGTAGVEDPAGLLAPLVRAALENSLAHGFSALSGPLLRGDRETIGNHLAALEGECPDILPAYRAMALATLDELERGSGTSRLSALRRDLE
ncbi:DUF2520 domain-containing protein [Novosphingobium sp. KCTC 2891]|uniref:Rossmann-like and DUF2520 domain-containing protein n=1 Tax=Novosphingobium sp. KCTC 2891 TaxID=2989730 RepID=UPI002223A827|nr:Rossmann-like and DUF2520 domain-containing protein [Novosphingobium sp. KCTC 2891]MCW1384136.1 DUF2520 domain-containing protein [Novosphingobium sp. KCTC 2891]